MVYCFTYDIRLEARFVFPLQKLSPIDVCKEMMSFDLRGTIRTQSALRIAVQQTGQKILGRGGNNLRPGEMERVLENFAVHFVGVFVIEGRKASQHFVE
jgi:hypothetical protein